MMFRHELKKYLVGCAKYYVMSTQNIAGTLEGWGYGGVRIFRIHKGYPLFIQYADEMRPT